MNISSNLHSILTDSKTPELFQTRSDFITVTVSGSGELERARALLQNVPGGIEKAAKAAISRTAQKVRSESSRFIRERYDITDANLRLAKDEGRQGRARKERNIGVRYSTGGNITATVTFSGHKIPLYRFGDSWPKVPASDYAAGKKPVMVKGKWRRLYQSVAAKGHQLESTGAAQFHDAFVATMKSGHTGIFARTGGQTAEGSDEIKEIYGSSVAQMIGHKEVAEKVTEHAWENFEKEINDAAYRILTGWR